MGTNATNGIKSLQKKNKQEAQTLKNQLDKFQAEVTQQQNALKKIEANPINWRQLAKLQNKKASLENNAEKQIKLLQGQYAINPYSVQLKKATLDLNFAKNQLKSVEANIAAMKKANAAMSRDSAVEKLKANILFNIKQLTEQIFRGFLSTKWTYFCGRFVSDLKAAIDEIDAAISVTLPPQFGLSAALVKKCKNVMSDLDNYCNIQTVENINQCGPYLLWQDINNVNPELFWELPEFQSNLKKAVILLRGLSSMCKPYLDLSGTSDMAAAQQALENGTATISEEECAPFLKRLEFLGATQAFYNSAMPILRNACDLLKPNSAAVCMKYKNWCNINLPGWHQNVQTFRQQVPECTELISKLPLLFSEIETQVKAFDPSMFNSVVRKIQSPAVSQAINKACQSLKVLEGNETRYNFSRFNKALSAICQDYMFGSTVVMNMTHTITYPDILPKTMAALKTAQENYDNVLDLEKMHNQQLAEKIAKTKAGLATEVKEIDEQIKNFDLHVESYMNKIWKDLKTMESRLDQYTSEQEINAKIFEKKFDNSVDAAISATITGKKSSPAAKHLEDSTTAVLKMKMSQLNATVKSAIKEADRAAKEAKKAAAIYTKLMEGNQLSFGSIAGSCEWTKDDMIFDLDVDFQFTLVIDIPLFNIDIHLPDPSATLHFRFSLDEIEQLFDNMFTLLWQSIEPHF